MRGWQKHMISGLLLLVAALLPQVIHNPYYLRLFILVMVNAVLAMVFVLGLRAGLLNLTIAGFYGIGAYAAGMIGTKTNVPVWLALPFAIAIAIAVSLVIGAVLLRGNAVSFIIGGLVFAFIVPLTFGTFSIFEGYAGIVGIPDPEPIPLGFGRELRFGSEPSYFYLALVLCSVVTVFLAALYRSWAGKAWLALGLSPDLAQTLAINPYRYRLLVFAISSAVTAIMGFFFAVYSSVIQPDAFDAIKAIYLQMYAVLGGVSFPFAGPLLGAAILTLLPELLRPVGYLEPIVTGAMIIAIVVLMPQGILGVARRLGGINFLKLAGPEKWRPSRLFSRRNEDTA